MAPGFSVIRLSKLRPFSGRSFTCARANQSGCGRRGRVDDGRLFRDGDFGDELAYLQLKIDRGILIKRQRDAGTIDGLESALLDPDFGRAQRQRQYAVSAGGIGSGGSPPARFETRDGDGGSGNAASRGVGHGTRDCGGHLRQGRLNGGKHKQSRQCAARKLSSRSHRAQGKVRHLVTNQCSEQERSGLSPGEKSAICHKRGLAMGRGQTPDPSGWRWYPAARPSLIAHEEPHCDTWDHASSVATWKSVQGTD